MRSASVSVLFEVFVQSAWDKMLLSGTSGIDKLLIKEVKMRVLRRKNKTLIAGHGVQVGKIQEIAQMKTERGEIS